MFIVVFWSHGVSVTAPHHRGHLLPPPIMGDVTGASDAPHYAKVSFFDNLLKKLDSSSSSQKNIWFSVPIPKIKFVTLPHKGKMLWCSYFKSLIKSVNFSRCGNFIEKLNFVSPPGKITIPLGSSVGDHIRVKEINLGR